jgi:preprotein translocase subunit SecG
MIQYIVENTTAVVFIAFTAVCIITGLIYDSRRKKKGQKQ